VLTGYKDSTLEIIQLVSQLMESFHQVATGFGYSNREATNLGDEFM
jgi:hypothetical protein